MSQTLHESRRPRIVELAGKLTGSSSGSFFISLVFTALMIHYCVFPLNAIWQTDGIVESDSAQAMWNLWSINEAITSGHNPYATNLLYYPIGVPNLSHQATAAGFFPVTFLVKTLTGGSALYPLYAYRLIILLCLVLLLYSSYWLLRELGFSAWGAATAAIAFSFSDFFMEHIAHINILAGFFIPLGALSLVRFYREPESIGNAIKAAILLAWAVYFTETTLYIYLGAFTFLVIMNLFESERRSLYAKIKQAGWRRVVPAAAIFLLLIAPYLILVLKDDSIKPYLSEHTVFSANLAGFFIPHPVRTPLYGTVFSKLASRITVGVGSYETFTSFVLVIFAVIGVLTTKQRPVRIAAVTALVFYVLSLGPTLKVFETDTRVTMPYAFLMRLPPFDWGRTPSRFIVIGMFFVMIVAASGLSWLGRVLARHGGWGASSTLMLVLLLWTIAEAYPPTPRQPQLIPPKNLATRVTGPVLNLPISGSDGYAMFLQFFHHQPLATGYLARNSPQRQQHIAELMRLFYQGGTEFCQGVAKMGIKTIIIAPDSYIERIAPDMGPLSLGECSLNIIDMREKSSDARDHAGGLQPLLADQPREFPLADVGTTINFNSIAAKPYLWYGWSGIEISARWSDRRKAAVVFSLGGKGDRMLLIKMFPFLVQGKLETQHVKIDINGHAIQTVALADHAAKVYRVTVPGPILQDKNILTFEMPDAESPISLGVSGDVRLLGINVEWIKLELADVELPTVAR
jgi:hypothetical protein